MDRTTKVPLTCTSRARQDTCVHLLQALPKRPPTPPSWPDFTSVTPRRYSQRDTIGPGVEAVPAPVQARLAEPIDVAAGIAAEEAKNADAGAGTLDTVAILLIVVVALLAVSLAGILWWFLVVRRRRQEVGVSTKEAMLVTDSSATSGVGAVGLGTTTVRSAFFHSPLPSHPPLGSASFWVLCPLPAPLTSAPSGHRRHPVGWTMQRGPCSVSVKRENHACCCRNSALPPRQPRITGDRDVLNQRSTAHRQTCCAVCAVCCVTKTFTCAHAIRCVS